MVTASLVLRLVLRPVLRLVNLAWGFPPQALLHQVGQPSQQQPLLPPVSRWVVSVSTQIPI